jgi:glycerol-3-phosphate dehydrogenase
MACHLDDIVFRRTDLGTLGNPGMDALQKCAQLMANELGWDTANTEQELARVLKGFIPDVGQARH